MNILMLTSNFPAHKGDVIQHPFQLDFIDLLREDNHTVTILTHAKGEVHEKIRDDLDINWFPWRRIQGRLIDIDFFKAGNIISLLSLVYRGSQHTRRIIRQERIDLVICLVVLPSGLYAYLNALLGAVSTPYFLWALGSDINKYRQNIFVRSLLKRIIRRSGHVFADGFQLCSTIHEMTGKACDFLPTFRKIDTRLALRIRKADDFVTFLYVGRHAKVKGIDVLIDAIIRLEKSGLRLDYRVIIAGEGELTPRMMERVTEKRLNHRVTFAGKVPDDRLFTLYAETDCVVIPSRSESIPVVFSEALQFNKPMIVTDVGDMGDLGRSYGVARVIGAADADALAGAMRDFIEEPFEAPSEKRNELLSLLMMENSMQKIRALISQLGAK
jgi:glycosyltransferase involved in cell wall biosynthesis